MRTTFGVGVQRYKNSNGSTESLGPLETCLLYTSDAADEEDV